MNAKTWCWVWLKISFSKPLWFSWLYCLLYMVILAGHAENGLNLVLLLKQIGGLVVVALFFGVLACIAVKTKLFTEESNGSS